MASNSLPKGLLEHLADHFAFAAERISETPDISRKVYYLSVFYGQPSRVLNLYWDRDLAFLWSVLQHMCSAIQGRLAQVGPAPFPVGSFCDEFGPAIDDVTGLLAASFGGGKLDKQRLYTALARCAELTFVSTGNGAYLVDKGLIDL